MSTRNYGEVRKPPVKQESPEQKNFRKKERQVMQHPRMTNVFEERNKKQNQELMELKPK